MGGGKPLAAVILLLVVLALPAANAQQLDMIVLLDISESVFPIFDELVGHLIQDTLTNHLRVGDYFHLITFADSPKIEVSQKIESGDQAEEIVTHLLLLQPLGKYTDLIAAMKYLFHYTGDLPNGRDKIILVLTDGIHDPPPGSPFNRREDEVTEELAKTTERIRSRGWDVRIMVLPAVDRKDEAGNNTDLLDVLSESLAVSQVEYPETVEDDIANKAFGHPRVAVPGEIERINRNDEIPLEVTNYSDETIYIKLRSLLVNSENVLVNSPDAVLESESTERLKARVRLPDSIPGGRRILEIEPEFSDGTRFSPETLTVTVNIEEGILRNRGKGLMNFVYVILGLIGAGGITFLVIKLRNIIEGGSWAPSAGVKTVYDRHTGERGDTAEEIELVVVNQTREIGHRNVHQVQEGHAYCVGGNGSRFLIFLYPFPRCIGELSKEGDSYVFTVRREEFFPTEDGRIKNCLNRRITAYTGKKHRVEFYFQKYESPLERINRIMRLTSEPGAPG
ncbi:MAG: vWA domain-containing protein [Spirochaetia bacterium]